MDRIKGPAGGVFRNRKLFVPYSFTTGIGGRLISQSRLTVDWELNICHAVSVV